jgi:serine/threonine protein kinase
MSPSADDRIDVVCDAFEASWIRGLRPNIEHFLNGFTGVERRLLFSQLLLLDVDYRLQVAEQPNASEYAALFPEFSAAIEEAVLAGTLISPSSNGSTHSDLTGAGKRIAHFELIEKIGDGAAGEVWKAKDLKLQRFVVVKFPHAHCQTDQDIHRFLREARATAQLRHPNIVPIYEVGRHGDRAYLVAEYIDGPNLRQWLLERRLPPKATAKFCATVLEALQQAHEHGIVHRDLKPANIIVDRDKRPHVTDFGLAKWSEDAIEKTWNGQILGTPAYMSPEQARGESGRVDRRADVFAMGVILYELLTGIRPFEGEPQAIIDAIIRRDPKSPRTRARGVPRDLETICLKALAKDVESRYQSAGQMAVDLHRFLRGEHILARRAGVLRKTWSFMKRRRALTSTFTLGLAALILLAGFLFVSKRNRELLGTKTVTLATNPPGAEVVFVPVNDSTGEPDSSHAIRAGRSPVRVDLPAGLYRVVAVLRDEALPRRQWRFHEVWRTVPAKANAARASYNHAFWEDKQSGEISLPAVTIPYENITRNMVLIRPEKSAPNDLDAGFYMDPAEFTQEACRRVFGRSGSSSAISHAEGSAQHANFDQAVMLMELVGERLPTLAEYKAASEFALRDDDDQRPSQLIANPLHSSGNLSTPMGAAFLSGLSDDPPEWTTTWPLPPKKQGDFSAVDELMPIKRLRMIWSGSTQAEATDSAVSNNTSHSTAVQRSAGSRKIGFRGVRSETAPYVD